MIIKQFEENKKFVELYNKYYNDNNLITQIVMNALQLDEYLANIVVDNYTIYDRYTLILKYTLQKLGKYKETINNYLIDTNNYMAKISKSNIIIGRFQARSYFRENPSKQSKTKNKS